MIDNNSLWQNDENSIKAKHNDISKIISETIIKENFNVAAEYMMDAYFFKRLNFGNVKNILKI